MSFVYNNNNLKRQRRRLRNNMTEPEQILWYYLKDKNLNNYKFRRQYSIGNYILDFYCPEVRLAIEIDCDSHFIDNIVRLKDKQREEFIKTKNVIVIRVY